MRQLLHTYTHLTCAPSLRRRDLVEACCEAKLDLAIEALLRETERADFLLPSIEPRLVQSLQPHEFGATTTSTFILDTLDVMKTFIGACAIIFESGLQWPNYTSIESDFKVLENPNASIRYGFSRVRYAHDETGEQVVVETRPVHYYRTTETHCILIWDFVDVDDKFPLSQATQIKKNACGA